MTYSDEIHNLFKFDRKWRLTGDFWAGEPARIEVPMPACAQMQRRCILTLPKLLEVGGAGAEECQPCGLGLCAWLE